MGLCNVWGRLCVACNRTIMDRVVRGNFARSGGVARRQGCCMRRSLLYVFGEKERGECGDRHSCCMRYFRRNGRTGGRVNGRRDFRL